MRRHDLPCACALTCALDLKPAARVMIFCDVIKQSYLYSKICIIVDVYPRRSRPHLGALSVDDALDLMAADEHLLVRRL